LIAAVYIPIWVPFAVLCVLCLLPYKRRGRR
jgi:hypothetical protein